MLIAPDSFKGTLGALEVANALCRGVSSTGWPVDVCPIADGGEGTLDALLPAMRGEIRRVTVHDPLGRPVEARFGMAGHTGVVETAAASGLSLIAPDERDPVAASTYGTGEVILATARAGARRVYIGVGGSATTDGGAGAIEAIRRGGGLGHVRLVVLCDVRTPFEQAARVFGPQKGANLDQVRFLTRRLHALAGRLERDPRGVPMSGAAGGLAGGLWAAFGAELAPGAGFLLEAIGFNRRMRAARAVITGEGKLDAQSLVGKAVSEVATRCRQTGVPSYAVVGQRELDDFGTRILDLQVVLEAGTLPALERAGRRLGEMI